MPKAKTKAVIPALFPQTVKVFEPTPGMQVWLDKSIELALDSPTDIAEASKLSRQNWYDWLKIDGFEEWFYDSYKQKRKRWIPALDNIGLKHAKKGDYNFWRDMNKKAGEDLDNKDNKVQVNIVNAIQEQKNKYGI